MKQIESGFSRRLTKILLSLSLLGTFASFGFAQTGVFGVGGSYAGPFDFEARARGGRTGFEAILFTPGADPSLNPPGTPVWTSGFDYKFEFTFNSLTGTSTWKIDFDKSGSLDVAETASETIPSLIGVGFQSVNVFLSGRTSPADTANLTSFSINSFTDAAITSGTPLTSGFSSTSKQYQASSIGDGSLTIFGTFNFVFPPTGTGSDEAPRFWIQVGNQVAIPEPSTYAALFGLMTLGFVQFRRFRQKARA